MMEKLRTAVENEGDTSIVKLAGFIDEHNRLRQLVEQITATTAMIDLSGVERINSSGVRDWVNWIAALEANGTKPVLVRCSPAIVAQINLVKNFTGNGAVKSFQVPYRCRECDEEKTIVVETSDMVSPDSSPPECRCIVCGHAMEVDEMPESYFAFLGQPSARAGEDILARGSRATISKVRTRTRERRSSPPARQSQPVLSAFQTNTPTAGLGRQTPNDLLLGKRPSRPSRPSQSRIAIGSHDRISNSQVPNRPSASAIEPKSNALMLVTIILVLLLGIGALGYVVFIH
jgi:anti-anti-sigma regulatory factor